MSDQKYIKTHQKADLKSDKIKSESISKRASESTSGSILGKHIRSISGNISIKVSLDLESLRYPSSSLYPFKKTY